MSHSSANWDKWWNTEEDTNDEIIHTFSTWSGLTLLEYGKSCSYFQSSLQCFLLDAQAQVVHSAFFSRLYYTEGICLTFSHFLFLKKPFCMYRNSILRRKNSPYLSPYHAFLFLQCAWNRHDGTFPYAVSSYLQPEGVHVVMKICWILWLTFREALASGKTFFPGKWNNKTTQVVGREDLNFPHRDK